MSRTPGYRVPASRLSRDLGAPTMHERAFLRDTELRHEQCNAAARYVASRSLDLDDARTLLDMLGLLDGAT